MCTPAGGQYQLWGRIVWARTRICRLFQRGGQLHLSPASRSGRLTPPAGLVAHASGGQVLVALTGFGVAPTLTETSAGGGGVPVPERATGATPEAALLGMAREALFGPCDVGANDTVTVQGRRPRACVPNSCRQRARRQPVGSGETGAPD